MLLGLRVTTGGGLEGFVIGGAAGLGYSLATARPGTAWRRRAVVGG